jgi:hypothetical protein
MFEFLVGAPLKVPTQTSVRKTIVSLKRLFFFGNDDPHLSRPEKAYKHPLNLFLLVDFFMLALRKKNHTLFN